MQGFTMSSRRTTAAALGVLALASVAGTAACAEAARPAAGSVPRIAAPAAPARDEPVAVPVAAGKRVAAPVTAEEVRQASIRIPRWNTDFCPSGTFKFHNGRHGYGTGAFVMRPGVVLADVDRDGDRDAVVLVACSPHAVTAHQVLALHRTADGRIATLGQVTIDGTVPAAGRIDGIAAGERGTVRVRWAAGPARQWRTYAYGGHGFRQVAGPRAFPEVRDDVAVRAVDPVLTRDAFYAWAGDLVVTVTNRGNRTVEWPVLRAAVEGGGVQSVSGALDDQAVVIDNGNPRVHLIGLASLRPGRSATVTLHLIYPGDAEPHGGTVTVDVTDDRTPADNTARFAVTTSE